jgi:hypothetical protein
MKVRFARGPTGSLHIGGALGTVADRSFGGTMLLGIDETPVLWPWLAARSRGEAPRRSDAAL